MARRAARIGWMPRFSASKLTFLAALLFPLLRARRECQQDVARGRRRSERTPPTTPTLELERATHQQPALLSTSTHLLIIHYFTHPSLAPPTIYFNPHLAYLSNSSTQQPPLHRSSYKSTIQIQITFYVLYTHTPHTNTKKKDRRLFPHNGTCDLLLTIR